LINTSEVIDTTIHEGDWVRACEGAIPTISRHDADRLLREEGLDEVCHLSSLEGLDVHLEGDFTFEQLIDIVTILEQIERW
jgi:hypothetical protein